MGGRKGSSGMSGSALYKIGEDQLAQMTQAQRDALMFYSNGNGMVMNDYLRGGTEYRSYGRDFAGEVRQNTATAVQALNQASLPREVNTMRGASIDELNDLYRQTPGARSDPSKLVGKTYTNKGMLSTTTERDYAEEYATSMGPSNGVLFHTNFKKGAKAVHIDPLHGKEWENEVLGAPNRRFKITRAYRDRSGLLHVHMTGG